VAAEKTLKVALAGNPNSGKSTLFNILTGLNQKIGNFPGVTVDKKSGFAKIKSTVIEFIDFPGSYSLNALSEDEKVLPVVLHDKNNPVHPDVVLYVADATNLRRSLFLCTQIMDTGIPVILVLNMIDLLEKSDEAIDVARLAEELGIKVFAITARDAKGIEELKLALIEPLELPKRKILSEEINESDKAKKQRTETIQRYKAIGEVLKKTVTKKESGLGSSVTKKIDDILTHRIYGFLIFFAVLFLVFQSIFSWSAYPMELIEKLFSAGEEFLLNHLPAGMLTELISERNSCRHQRCGGFYSADCFTVCLYRNTGRHGLHGTRKFYHRPDAAQIRVERALCYTAHQRCCVCGSRHYGNAHYS
jgi:ferrous iron transport protein B